MFGALIGDITGSRYEWKNIKTKDFNIFDDQCRFTDDSVMTFAIADALSYITHAHVTEDDDIKRMFKIKVKQYGRLYPTAGYGGKFSLYINTDMDQPYGSWGNGSAMRVSQCGWLFDTLEETEKMAELSASITHDHPEGIKGAKAIAGSIFIARTTHDKQKVKEYIESLGYEIPNCDEIRPTYTFDVSCQGTVPPAIAAFLEGENFEDVLRIAVSLGGDCDTLTSIACAVAEAYYEIQNELKLACSNYLDDMLNAKLLQYDGEMKR